MYIQQQQLMTKDSGEDDINNDIDNIKSRGPHSWESSSVIKRQSNSLGLEVCLSVFEVISLTSVYRIQQNFQLHLKNPVEAHPQGQGTPYILNSIEILMNSSEWPKRYNFI